MSIGVGCSIWKLEMSLYCVFSSIYICPTLKGQVSGKKKNWCSKSGSRLMRILRILKESSLNSTLKDIFGLKKLAHKILDWRVRIYCLKYSVWRLEMSLYCLFSSIFIWPCSSTSHYEAIDTLFIKVHYIYED